MNTYRTFQIGTRYQLYTRTHGNACRIGTAVGFFKRKFYRLSVCTVHGDGVGFAAGMSRAVRCVEVFVARRIRRAFFRIHARIRRIIHIRMGKYLRSGKRALTDGLYRLRGIKFSVE